MRVSYNKLWKLLIDKKMRKIDLRNKTRISSSTLALIGKDHCVSMNVLIKICDVLQCNLGDIVDILPNEDKK